jgi:hypothetical protein
MAEDIKVLGRIGGEQKIDDGSFTNLAMNPSGAALVQTLHGRYTERARRGKVFAAASQAATTWTVALNTTFTGLVVYNPAGSPVDLAILQAGFALSVAPAGIASVSLFGGGTAAGIATHTTPLTPYCTYLGGPVGYGKADAAATLVGTQVHLMPIMGGFTAAALPSPALSVVDVGGSIVVPPGYHCGIACLTVAIGFAAMIWEEILR